MSAADPLIVRAVAAGAVCRMRAAGIVPNFEGCECDHRADAPPGPWPEAENSRPWCILCAVESEVDGRNLHGDYYSHVLSAVAGAVSGREFSLENGTDRDDVLFGWSENSTSDEIISVFERIAS